MTTNQPSIRKGQHKPYVKATGKQIEQRIGAATVLNVCGYSKSEIHRVFREKYGVEWRQTDRYMARARACEATLTHGSAQLRHSILDTAH